MAAVRFDDLPRQHEPETRPADAPLPPDIAAEELREDLFLVTEGDAETFVAHPDPRLVPDE